MRQLGSFHIAMNGMAASDKIFRLMDLQEGEKKRNPFPNDCTIACQNLHFAYEPEREVLKGVDLHFPRAALTAIVGESGCGSLRLLLFHGTEPGYTGSVTVGGVPLCDISEESLLERFTYVSHQSHLF